MIPSINIVLAGPLALAAALVFVTIISAVFLSGVLVLPSDRDVARIALAVVAMYGFSWVENEWRSFDGSLEHGAYFPIIEEPADADNLFMTMALSATAPFLHSNKEGHKDDDDATEATNDDSEAEAESVEEGSSTPGDATPNVWNIVLATAYDHLAGKSSKILEPGPTGGRLSAWVARCKKIEGSEVGKEEELTGAHITAGGSCTASPRRFHNCSASFYSEVPHPVRSDTPAQI